MKSNVIFHINQFKSYGALGAKNGCSPDVVPVPFPPFLFPSLSPFLPPITLRPSTYIKFTELFNKLMIELSDIVL